MHLTPIYKLDLNIGLTPDPTSPKAQPDFSLTTRNFYLPTPGEPSKILLPYTYMYLYAHIYVQKHTFIHLHLHMDIFANTCNHPSLAASPRPHYIQTGVTEAACLALCRSSVRCTAVQYTPNTSVCLRFGLMPPRPPPP